MAIITAILSFHYAALQYNPWHFKENEVEELLLHERLILAEEVFVIGRAGLGLATRGPRSKIREVHLQKAKRTSRRLRVRLHDEPDVVRRQTVPQDALYEKTNDLNMYQKLERF